MTVVRAKSSIHLIAAAGVFAAAAVAASTGAFAQADVMKQCGEKWQAAKAANTTGGQTWNQFLAKCRTDTAQAPAAKPAETPAAKPAAATTATTPAKPDAAGAKPAATHAVFPAKIDPKYATEKPAKQRMQTCLDQYNANKAKDAGAGNGGLNWIQKGGGYYSECNKRLGGGKSA